MIRVPNIDAEVLSLRQTAYSSNNAVAIMALLKFEDGETEEQAVSVNLDHADNLFASKSLQPGEFYCKNWSEGADLYEALVTAEWLAPTGAATRCGHVRPPICRLGSKAVIA